MRQLSLILWFLLTACAQQPSIDMVSKPILFDENRKQLSLQYMKQRYGIEQTEPHIEPQMVVVHWTVIPTLEKTFDAFNPATLPASRAKISTASALNVSAHFLVDRDGTIYQLLDTHVFARHTIGLNHTAIGIENIANGRDLPLTDEQIQSNITLINYLSSIHDIHYVIGHHEYQQFIGHELWKEKDPAYLTEKNDPGDANIRRIRAGLAKLGLKPLPIYNRGD